jgi:peptide/nickel transport system permease protein/oligopeptide transport system permease protein
MTIDTVLSPGADSEPPIPSTDPVWRALMRHPLGLCGGLIVAAAVAAALFAPILAPHDPDQQFATGLTSAGMPAPPGGAFLLGADNLGRDMLSRLLFGARVSLEVGIFAIVVAMGIGVLVGVASGYAGGWLDTALMRLTDVVMTIPSILLAIALAAVHGHGSEVDVFIAIGFASWTGVARLIRSQVLQVKQREFVEAARALGAGPFHIAWRHILPNILPLIVVLGTLGAAGTILLDAGLSYLGLGVPPPAASWGKMIADGQDYYISAPWILLEPGVAASVVVVGFNMLGQALQEVLDPYRLS